MFMFPFFYFLVFLLLQYLNGSLDLNALSLFLCGKDGWKSRWVRSDWKSSEGKAGSFKHTAGKWSGDPDDKGLCFLVLLLYKYGS